VEGINMRTPTSTKTPLASGRIKHGRLDYRAVDGTPYFFARQLFGAFDVDWKVARAFMAGRPDRFDLPARALPGIYGGFALAITLPEAEAVIAHLVAENYDLDGDWE
jgi:hypothetical protein